MNARPRIPILPLLLMLLAFHASGCSFWPLEKRVLSNSRHIRSAALRRIRHMEEEDRLPLAAPLIKTLSAPDDRIANRAAEALVAVGEPAVDQLTVAAEAQDPYIRTLSVMILGEIGTPTQKIGPALVSALEDQHPLVRAEAAHALGRLGAAGAGAVPALFMSLSDPDPEVRESVESALKRLGAKPPPPGAPQRRS
jgi:HEAT repeat protein